LEGVGLLLFRGKFGVVGELYLVFWPFGIDSVLLRL
jgi:hypothetical protein